MAREHLVRDFMTSPATTLPHTASLLDAALKLRSTGYRHLPIVDGQRLVGIVSDRDILWFSPSLLGRISQEEYNSIFENTPLERVMSRDPLTVTPTTPLREAAALLYERKLGCLPVVEDGRLAGIITITDMLAILLRFLSAAVNEPVAGRG